MEQFLVFAIEAIARAAGHALPTEGVTVIRGILSVVQAVRSGDKPVVDAEAEIGKMVDAFAKNDDAADAALAAKFAKG